MTIKDLKAKIVTTLGEIDLSKLTLAELHTYINMVSETEQIATKEQDHDLYSKLLDNISTCAISKVPTINEMKGD
jgi:hypothetical protein